MPPKKKKPKPSGWWWFILFIFFLAFVLTGRDGNSPEPKQAPSNVRVTPHSTK